MLDGNVNEIDAPSNKFDLDGNLVLKPMVFKLVFSSGQSASNDRLACELSGAWARPPSRRLARGVRTTTMTMMRRATCPHSYA